ncbi:MAG: ferredoxin [Gammaproteobacteria bacterium]|jgi:ferredoxin
MTRLKVSIDRKKCVGSGNCVYVAPEVFSQDDCDGIVILLIEHPIESLSSAVAEAQRQCPSMAIRTEQL